MGRMVDEVDRKKIITYSLMVQNGCVMICAVFLYLLLPFEAPNPPLGDWRFLSLFFSLVAVHPTVVCAHAHTSIAPHTHAQLSFTPLLSTHRWVRWRRWRPWPRTLRWAATGWWSSPRAIETPSPVTHNNGC